MDWILIATESDITELMNQFGYFHDACLKEMHYKSGTYVNDDLSMSMINEPVVRFIFQRQLADPCAIEIEFADIVEFHVKPPEKEYSTEIFEAKLMKINELFYWADWDNWDKDSKDRDSATWICAKSVRWRKREDLIGGELFYIRSMNRIEITIDGNNFIDLEGFYDEIDRVLTKDLTWKTGHNLNAFNDILRGGFGVHEYGESIVLVWEKFLKSKSDLGYSETIKHYKKMLKTCHQSNIPSVKQFLKDAENRTGETLFDLIIEIINDHDNITFVIR